jgi:hypothetical protein
MDEASPAEGVEQFIRACKDNSVIVSIISHKTIYPALGPKVNLQEAAQKWLENRGIFSKVGQDHVVFEEKLVGKLAQIKQRRCTHFIDDLDEVLLHPDFPMNVKKILYAQTAEDLNLQAITHFKDWNTIRNYFFG